uniref:translation initiation factor IF-2-like n=1 Tax=Euleptes europaea TaxID=460621 RepID=UPI00253FB628|nr:translation initiation factor IF-2-like [Euleptes europaea]
MAPPSRPVASRPLRPTDRAAPSPEPPASVPSLPPSLPRPAAAASHCPAGRRDPPGRGGEEGLSVAPRPPSGWGPRAAQLQGGRGARRSRRAFRGATVHVAAKDRPRGAARPSGPFACGQRHRSPPGQRFVARNPDRSEAPRLRQKRLSGPEPRIPPQAAQVHCSVANTTAQKGRTNPHGFHGCVISLQRL